VLSFRFSFPTSFPVLMTSFHDPCWTRGYDPKRRALMSRRVCNFFPPKFTLLYQPVSYTIGFFFWTYHSPLSSPQPRGPPLPHQFNVIPGLQFSFHLYLIVCFFLMSIRSLFTSDTVPGSRCLAGSLLRPRLVKRTPFVRHSVPTFFLVWTFCLTLPFCFPPKLPSGAPGFNIVAHT